MKIIWSLPTFDNPQTGGEKVFTRLAELLESKGSFIINTYRESKERGGALRRIFINFRNFKILMRQDKHALIFQNFHNRSEFFLCNIILHIFFRRKIIIFINEIEEIMNLKIIRKLHYSFVNFVTFQAASLIVVNSRFTGSWACNFGNFKKKLFLMYPVIDISIEDRKRLNKAETDPITILCVGNIRRNKGQIYLLQAMEYIQKDIKISFVGLIKEKDYMDKLKEYVNKKCMSYKVKFTGFLSGQQLSEEYKKADIFVLPTLKEGFGITVLEAMSYGLPVIASDVGAIPELIDDRINGLLVEPGNPKLLSRAILKILDYPRFKEQLQKNALEKLAQFKTIEEEVDHFCGIL